MAGSVDPAVLVDGVFGSGNDARIDRHYRIRLYHKAVKVQLHPTFADKMAWVFVRRKVAHQIAAVGKAVPAVGLGVTQLAKHRIADVLRLGRDIRFGHGAVDH